MAIKVSDLIRTEIPDNVELPGTEGMTVPGGTSAERPLAPINGELRFNDDIGLLEIWNEDLAIWAQIRTGAQSILFPPNVIYVTLTPSQNPRQFTSVSAALAFITDNSPTNLYTIYIEPGTYVEPQLVMKPWVNVVSRAGPLVTILTPSNPNQNFVIASNFMTIAGLSITGVTGARGLYFVSTDSSASGTFRAYEMRFIENQIDFQIHCTTEDSYSILKDLHFVTASDNTINHFMVTSDGTNDCEVLSHDLDCIYVSGNNIENALFISGPQVEFNCDGLQLAALTTNSPGDGIVIEDSAVVNITSGTTSGFDYNIRMNNVGGAPSLFMYGEISKHSTTYDLFIGHPGAVGVFVGAANFTKTYIDPVSTFVANYTDVDNRGQVTVGNYYVGSTQDTLTNVTPLISQTPPLGAITGGEIVPTLNPLEVSVNAGSGYVSYDVGPDSSIKEVVWTTTLLNLTNDAVNYISVDIDGVVSATLLQENVSENIYLGRVLVQDNNIGYISITPYSAIHTATQIDTFLRDALGAIYVSGSLVSENSMLPLLVDVTPGEYYYSTHSFNPAGGSPVSLRSLYLNGTDYVTTIGVPLDNVNYNDTSLGLVPLSSGYYTKHVLYVAGEGADEKYAYVYGQDEYATLVEVEDAALPATPPFFTEDIVPIAAIIVQQGNPNIVQPIIDIRPRLGFQPPSSTASSVHGNLLGLSSDDHLQYILTNGNRVMTGDLNLGTNDVINVGLVDGVDVSAHASRHQPDGSDAIPTAAPITSLSPSSLNATGTANTLSRSDHSHQITGFQPLDSDLTALSEIGTFGLYTITGSGTSTTRTLQAGSSAISINDADGISGNPTIDINESNIDINDFSNVLSIVKGGTGLSASPSDGQIDIGNGTGFTRTTLTAGTGVSIANGSGSISISADEANININNLSGTLSVNKGGTGLSSTPSNGQLDIGNGTSFTRATLTAGTGVSITNGAGSITLGVNESAISINNLSGTLSVNKGGTGLTTTPSNGQIDIGNGTGFTRATLTAGTGVSITNGAGSVTLAVNEAAVSINNLSGTLSVGKGGTGLTSTPTNGQLDIGNGTGFTRTTLTAGSGISITNGAGSVTISSSSGVGALYKGTVPTTSGNTQIPADNTVPLNTEGTQLWSQVVTPASVSSTFIIDFSSIVGTGTNNRQVTFALFRNTTCIAASTSWVEQAKPQVNRIYVEDSPATVSPVTYSLRVGNSGAGNIWYVGQADSFNYGSINQSLWTIREVF